LAPEAAEKPVSPESYTPRHLAEKILTSKTALEGERKQVTVLFADLKGSMELLADRDPEEARKVLDPVLTLMMDAVHHYEGTVNQVMGDGIMALFGAPLAHEDHAVRACYTALRMQDAVRRYSDELRRAQGVEAQIRVGVNSGDVVVRSIGSDLRMDYTAVGQTTHLAARMEQLAAPGSIRLTAETLYLAEGFVQVTPLGPVPIKGLGEPVEAFELVGAGAARTRLEAAARRGLSRFVGRNAELEQLRSALERANRGQGQVVAVVGEPGVGKSRLFREFIHSHRVPGWLIVHAASVSYGKATAYLPVIELLRGYFAIDSRADPMRVREVVTRKVLTLAPALGSVVLALLALLDVPVDEASWHALDPLQRRRQTLDAVKRLLLAESHVQPLLLVFEDLHWIDGETQAFFDTFFESVPTARILVLVNYRPEYQHTWGGKTYYTQLRIDPLPAEDVEEFLHALLGPDSGLDPLRRLLIERTEGNPFFLEESVRALVETRALVGEPGAHRLARAGQTLQIPATAQAILAARIDRLPGEAKRLLQTASVIGKDVPSAILTAIAELPEETLRRALGHLQEAEFLYETTLFPDVEYTFKHALTHEVAYGGLLHDRRRALHGEIVAAIEAVYQGRLADQVDLLAHHAVNAGLWDKAVTYCRQAGKKAVGRSANREAVLHFDRALEAVNHLPRSQDIIERAIDLRFDLRTALLALGELRRILDLLREAAALAEALGDRRRQGLACGFIAHCDNLEGSHEHAVESGQSALATALSLDDSVLHCMSSLYLGQTYLALGDLRPSVEFLTRAIALAEGGAVRERQGMTGLPLASRAWLIWPLVELGEFSRALVVEDEMLRLAEAVDRPGSFLAAYPSVAFLSLRRGHVSRAIAFGERAVALSERGDFPLMLPLVAGELGYAYALSGRIGEALAVLARAMEHAVRMNNMYAHSLIVGWLGEAYLFAEQPNDAASIALEALDRTRGQKERGLEAWTLRLIAEIALHRDPPNGDQADDRYREALALANELGMRPLVAHCHLGLGRLARRSGKGERAHEHLTTATTMYREMDMRYWLEKAEAQMRESP
jgi:class 3 adenylate cyclase/tetratricopeptide (TPR) repeat protein